MLNGVASLKSAREGDMVFVEDEKALGKAIQSHATAVIAGEFASEKNFAKPVLIASHPRLAFSRAAS